MLNKKEKLVMKYLNEVCIAQKTYLISADQIAQHVCRYFVLSVSELDDIMLELSKDNYLDFIAMDGRKGYYYCITLKPKGLTFKKDQVKHKKEVASLIARTLALALLSFAVGYLLKLIFKG